MVTSIGCLFTKSLKLRRRLTRGWSQKDDADESFSWPQGTKDNPATTCHELGLIQPHLNDGEGDMIYIVCLLALSTLSVN